MNLCKNHQIHTHCVNIGCTIHCSNSTDREMEDIGERDDGRR